MSDSRPTQAFRLAVEAGDHAAMMATISADISFNTPVYLNPIEDRDVVALLLEILLETFVEFHYTDEMSGESGHGLIFRAKVEELELEGLDLLRFDGDGLINDFTVMIRPLAALDRLRAIVTESMTQRLGG